MKKLIGSTIVLLALSLSATAQAAAVPNLTAGELSAHKVEKLITLKKLDASFQRNFRGLEVVNLRGGGAGKPTFKVVLSQEADAGKAANKVELTLDEKGKALGLPVVVAGVAASRPTVWSGKDPLTLTELALHHVEHLGGHAHHGGAGDRSIAQFIDTLKAIRITQVGANAQFEMVANGVKGRLVMNLDGQGKLINAQVVQ